MKFFVFKRETVLYVLISGIILATISTWFILKKGDTVVFNVQNGQNVREIHMVTGEFKTTMKDGTQIESYRWDPGTIFLEKGEKVNLYISGINGEEHPFYIEGTNLKGNVKKGEEVVVPLHFNQSGTYRLICKTHNDKSHSPMIAYIVVK
ncbi:MAG: cupredoxin domain-containing protein [Bacillota bacterium]|jgi:heme/copper-type cytochrome/quinol oxidase subunit 2|nr:cupredoxin domain-containing protein [Bacillota bacterium]MDP4156228.1 cupredoxin domain-containing protein [Bacillota bacterium]